MKLAASNIAWDPDEDDAVADILRDRGFTGVEIAPSKRWQSPINATAKEISEYRRAWETRGLSSVAMQSLLFGRSDLQLFGPEAARRSLRDYLTALIGMANGLGARALVFGSPANRKRGDMPLEQATEVAANFFQDMGTVAASNGCAICIEPNPTSYGCDFINTTAEAVALCELIGSPGVKVNGDAGAIAINGEDARGTVDAAARWFGHFHASEPSLAEVTEGAVHQEAATALRRASYSGWVSIEMRGGTSSRPEAIARAADRVRRSYGA